MREVSFLYEVLGIIAIVVKTKNLPISFILLIPGFVSSEAGIGLVDRLIYYDGFYFYL